MKFIALVIFFVLSACSTVVDSKNTSNSDVEYTANMRQGRSIAITDRTDYYLTVNKAYFVVTPVREYQGRYYLVDHNGYIMLSKPIDIMSGHTTISFPKITKRYYVPKHGTKSIDFGPCIDGFLVWYMDPMYTFAMEVALGLSYSVGFSPTTGTAVDYIQKLRYPYQNFFIDGHYWYELFVLKVDSILNTDM
ncbi:MAG: hypothetical protein ACRC0X_02725 [Brevinema sp.]